jgi:outer membrane receptor protein involved in Fe transport
MRMISKSPNLQRTALLSGAALFALSITSPAFAQAAPAQAPAPTSVSDVATQNPDDIVVTARKRSEKLQDVPLSITALTGADLQAAGVQDLRDITQLTPGLTFTTGAGANYFSKPIIRGQTDLGGGDNNVPVFFDGIYISNTSAIDFGLVDLARVEVIKGPVSATYGRSAYAGAINYVSAKPTDTVTGELSATGGTYGKYAFNGRISGAIVPGILKGGISASYDHFNGTYHDPATNQNRNGYIKRDILANLDFTPSDHVEIRPVLYYGNDKFLGQASVFGPANCGVNPGLGSYTATYCGKFPDSSPTLYGPYAAGGDQYGQTGNSRKVLMTNLQAAFTYDWGTISSLTGFAHYRTNEYNEFDDQSFGTLTNYYALPAGATVGTYPTGANVATFGTNPAGQVLTPLHFGYTDRNDDFSQELRYSTPQSQPIRGSFGGYFARSTHDDVLNLARGTCSVPAGYYIVDYFAVPCGTTYSGQQTAYHRADYIRAAFASFDADIVHNLTFSTELRYSWTTSKYDDIQAIFSPFPTRGYSTSTASGFTPLGAGVGEFRKTFRSLTSRSSLTYKPTSDLTIYASAANGEKIGGFNNTAVIANQTYNPEKNWTYEVGVKSQMFDRHLQLDADVYYIDSSDFQLLAPPPGATLPGGFITTNLGGLRTKGAEITAAVVVNSWARVSTGVAFTDPKFKSDAFDFGDYALCSAIATCYPGRQTVVRGSNAIVLDGLRPPYESNFTFNTTIDLHPRLSDTMTGIFRLDYRHGSSQFYQYPIDTGYYGPQDVVNVRAGFETGRYSFIVYVRNLTNDKTPDTVQDAAVTGATGFQAGYFPVAVLPDRRTVGATLRFKFGS